MLTSLRDKSKRSAKPGFLVKAVRGGFDFTETGDVPIGVLYKSLGRSNWIIQDTGTADVMVEHNVVPGDELRMPVSGEGGRAGTARAVGDATEYISIGRAIGKGKGLIEVALNISAGGGGSGGGGGVSDHTLLTNIGVNTHAQIDTFISSVAVTSVTGSNGIHSSGGTTPDISFDGTTLPVATTTLLFSAGIVAVAGTQEERYIVEDIPLSIFDNDYGWTTNVGTVTSVQGSGAITASGAAIVTVGFDAELLPIQGASLLDEDYILVWDFDTTTTGRKLISTVPLGEFNNNEGWASGTVESVIGGYGIASDSDPVNPSLSFDGTELDIDAGTSWNPPTTSPYLIFTVGSVTERILASNIGVLSFNNDAGWTNNAGTVTSVQGSGNVDGITLSGSGSGAVSLSLGGSWFRCGKPIPWRFIGLCRY